MEIGNQDNTSLFYLHISLKKIKQLYIVYSIKIIFKR